MNMPSILSDFVETIIRNSQPATVKIDGVEYPTLKTYDPRIRPAKADPLTFTTLDGFAAFLEKSELIQLSEGAAKDFPYGPSQLIIHIEGPRLVSAVGYAREEWHDREVVAQAKLSGIRYEALNDGYRENSIEDMIVCLRTLFDVTDDRDALVAVLGNVVAGKEIRVIDDGFSQEVVVQEAVRAAWKEVIDDGFSQEVVVQEAVRAAWKELPNPATLQPFRTFPEVEQPTSPFLIRLSGGWDKKTTCRLVLADGGLWECDAMMNIAAYLGEKLPGFTVLY